MFANEKISELESILRSAGNIVIVTHVRPDGDAVGSSLGMRNYLSCCLRKENVKVIFPNRWPGNTDFAFSQADRNASIIFSEEPEKAREALSCADLLIFVDLNEFSRTGSDFAPVLGELSEGTPKVLIDHHLNPDSKNFNLVFSTQEISSASELLLHILSALPSFERMSPEEGLNAIMCGITMDTNNFANSVFPSTFQACSMLLSLGVDREMILEKLYHEYKENRVRLMGMLLSERMVITGKGVAVLLLREKEYKDYGMEQGDLDGLVNVPLSIGKVKMSIYLREDGGLFHVSIRSKEGVSANAVARRYFHGGGHEKASGGTLFVPDDIQTKEDATGYVIRVTDEYFTEAGL